LYLFIKPANIHTT